MRLLSACSSALTVLLVFLFVRELLPRLAGSLGARRARRRPPAVLRSHRQQREQRRPRRHVSAALFAALARAFRLGLTPRRAVAIAGVVALGVLTKPTFYGLLPGTTLAVLFLLAGAWRADRAPGSRRTAIAGVAPAVRRSSSTSGERRRAGTVRSVPDGERGLASAAGGAPPSARSLGGLLSYAVQFWLPRPPFLTDQVSGVYPLCETMSKGFIGRFGWVDYEFPQWVFTSVLVVWGALLGLTPRALARSRAALRARVPRDAVLRPDAPRPHVRDRRAGLLLPARYGLPVRAGPVSVPGALALRCSRRAGGARLRRPARPVRGGVRRRAAHRRRSTSAACC